MVRQVIGLDTNVLVRYLLQDDEAQSRLATDLIEGQLSDECPGYISLVVLIEVGWVIKRFCKADKSQLIDMYRQILETECFTIQHREVIYSALGLYAKGNADFSDAVIYLLAKQDGCRKVVTFDKKARSFGMELLG